MSNMLVVHLDTLQNIFIHFCVHTMNVSPISSVFFALFWSQPTPEGYI